MGREALLGPGREAIGGAEAMASGGQNARCGMAQVRLPGARQTLESTFPVDEPITGTFIFH